MNSSPFRRFIRFACAGALSLAFVASATALDAPKFSDPEVTAFAKLYLEFADEAAVAYKAAKSGDTSKVAALQAKSQAIQEKQAAVTSKVTAMKPDEAERFQKFILECTQRMTDAMK